LLTGGRRATLALLLTDGREEEEEMGPNTATGTRHAGGRVGLLPLGVAYGAALVVAALVWIEGTVDDDTVWYALLGGIAAVSVAVGAAAGRWRAAWLALALPAALLSVDLLWAAGIVDRSEEWEPLPVTFVALWLPWLVPAVAALIAVGVAVRRLAGRLGGHR
jgi:hypothetical protein